MVELKRIFLVPVVDGDGTVPPHTVVEHGGRVRVVPPRGLEVEVFLKVGHPVPVRVGYGAVHTGGGQRVKPVFPLPAVGQAVVVRIRVVRLRVHEVFQTVGEAVAVLIRSGLHVNRSELNGGERGGHHQHGEHD